MIITINDKAPGVSITQCITINNITANSLANKPLSSTNRRPRPSDMGNFDRNWTQHICPWPFKFQQYKQRGKTFFKT